MKLSKKTWVDHPSNPLIKPPFPEWLIADPTVLPAKEAPDGKWHLFAHGLLGIYHYRSYDGVRWQRVGGIISFLALRPFIFHEKGKYYLFYEKLSAPFGFPYYNSHLQQRSSTDLLHWSQPKTLLKPKYSWHKTKNKIGNLGNPSLVKTSGTYRLYYSSGLISFSDTFFCEPGYQGVATAKKITGPYHLIKKPLIKKGSAKLLKSTTKVVSTDKGFLGLQTLFRTNLLSRASSSAIHFSFSSDGIKWVTVKKPIITPNAPWKKTHVYVGSYVKKENGKRRIYYNARENRGIFGREMIGLATSK
jgi:predicted GH43/DUF377 family glycosyl hydrolase